jgi:hypothetical protein
VTVQTAEPPLNSAEPSPPESGQRELFHQADDLAGVLGGHEVFQCLLGPPLVQAPAGRAAPQHRQQTGLEPFQFGQEHVAEQVMVAVPVAAPVQRHQQQVGAGQLGQGRGGAGHLQDGFAQRPGHPFQDGGPGQEHPVPRRDPS